MNDSLEREVTSPLYQWLSRAGDVGCPHGQRTMFHSGELRPVTDVCDTFGIIRMVLSKTLDMLDHTPEEIATILRETY